jgi:hypothetical protein
MSETTKNEIGKTSSVLDDFIAEATLARDLAKSPKTVLRWRKNGKGPKATIIGRKVFYRRSAIAEWLIACESKGTKRAPRQHRRSRAA